MNADADASFAFAQNVSGWLTCDQAVRLAQATRALRPEPVVVEIGSHHGKSTIVLGGARADAQVHAVDPFADEYGGREARAAFEQNVSRAGVRDRITLHPVTSRTALRTWTEPIDLLYVDGKHDVVSCLRDLRWSRHGGPDAPVLVHDAFSSVGVTLAVLWSVVVTGRYEYLGRTGSLAELRRRPASLASRRRCAAELPWWCRNLVLKALLRLRLRRVAAALGHHGRHDPY